MNRILLFVKSRFLIVLLTAAVANVTAGIPKRIQDRKTIRVQSISVDMLFGDCVATKGAPASKKRLKDSYEVIWKDGVSAIFRDSDQKSIQVFGSSLEVAGNLVAKPGISSDSLDSRTRALGLGEPIFKRPFGVSMSEKGKPLSQILYHTAEIRVAGMFIEFRFSHNRLEHVLVTTRR